MDTALQALAFANTHFPLQSKTTSRVNQLEEALESIKDSVLCVDSDLVVTLMNSAAVALFQVSTWIDEPVSKVANVKAFVDFLARQNKRDDDSFEFEITQGPHIRHILARVTLQDNGSQVCVLRDVTTVRRLERIRRDFVANVSHELRTPISVVRANTETLLDGAIHDPEFAPRLLEAVHRNAERLTLLINDLLDLSRLESGSYSLSSGRIQVRGVAERVEESLREKSQARNTNILISIPLAIAVRTDEAALFQVLVNYLENAIKYTPEGSRIEIGAHLVEKMVRIEVRDNGPGIPAPLQNRVFERFFRVDPGRSRQTGGTGLGLSIVKHLVEAMGGRVGVSAIEPTGCAFWLQLASA